MTDLSPALAAEFEKDQFTAFVTLTLHVGGSTHRFLDGASQILIGGQLYRGDVEGIGVWSSLDSFEDGTGDEAPGLAVTLQPASHTAALLLSAPSMQGQTIQIHVGAMNATTGLVVGELFHLFDGEVDVPRHEFGEDMLQVSLECVGGMERLFFDDEGLRLAQTFHQQCWPDEQGFSHVTGIRDTIYWGANAPTRKGLASSAWVVPR